MINYILGAFFGGIFGYFVLYRLVGCTSGACSIVANPYISTIFGIIIGILIAGSIGSPNTSNISDESNKASGVEYKKITGEEAKSRIGSEDNVVIVDVRTEAEYNSGHIPNAVLIPNETISDSMPELLPDLDAEVIVYCRSGNRSAQASKKLIAIGYTNVYDLGGIGNWPYDIVTTK